MKKIFEKFIYLSLILSLYWVGAFLIDNTFAYFNDTEITEGNLYQVGTLKIETNPESFNWRAPLPSPNNINTLVSTTTKIKNTGTVDLNYEVRISNFGGNLCSDLKINGNTLEEFYKEGNINSGEDNNLNINISSNADLSYQETKECNFNFEINAWQKYPENMKGKGFSDSENISVGIVLEGHYDEYLEDLLPNSSDIVLNEFLPIGEKYTEFIEIYNKGNQSKNISTLEVCYVESPSFSWSLKDSLCNENPYPLSGEISGKGFFVIQEENLLGDQKGIITLWNSSDNLVDAHTYYNKEDNFYTDKSFARIPDGSPNWVDPIPTPGGANIKENEENNEENSSTSSSTTSTPTIKENTTASSIQDNTTGTESTSSDPMVENISTTTNEISSSTATTDTSVLESESTSTEATTVSSTSDETLASEEETSTSSDSTSTEPTIENGSTTKDKIEEPNPTPEEESSTTDKTDLKTEENNAETTEETIIEEEDNTETEEENISTEEEPEEDTEIIEEEPKEEPEPVKLEEEEDNTEPEDNSTGDNNETDTTTGTSTNETNNEN